MRKEGTTFKLFTTHTNTNLLCYRYSMAVVGSDCSSVTSHNWLLNRLPSKNMPMLAYSCRPDINMLANNNGTVNEHCFPCVFLLLLFHYL